MRKLFAEIVGNDRLSARLLQFIISSMSSLFAKLKSIPFGFKSLLIESKLIFFIYRTKGDKITRRETELIRSNLEALKKISPVLLTCSIPIFGYLPSIIALRYPKQLLSEHFWNDEQRKKFYSEEVSQRRLFREEFLSTINQSNFKSGMSCITLSDMSPLSIRTLAGANSICSSIWLLDWAPTFLLRQWLERRGQELLTDDQLLTEEGIVNLSENELQLACLRRGVDPLCQLNDLDEKLSQLRSSLSLWLHVAGSDSRAPTATAIARILFLAALGQPNSDPNDHGECPDADRVPPQHTQQMGKYPRDMSSSTCSCAKPRL